MCFISEGFSHFLNDAIDMINRKSTPKHIVLCDKDYIGLVQCVIRIALSGEIGIQQAAVISCPLCDCSTVTALNLDIVGTVFMIHCQNVKPHGTALYIVQVMLPIDFFDLQIIPIQDDPEQEFRTRLIFKDLAHKVIIHEPKITDTPQILLMLALKIKVVLCFDFCHRFTCFLFLV